MADHSVLDRAHGHARAFLGTLASRPVGVPVAPDTLRADLGGPLPERGEDPGQIIDRLVDATSRGLVASAGPRYFGFVIGGSLPVTVAADWLTAVWDQNAALYISSPAAAAVEEIAASWLLQILGLPVTCSVAFVTGATMANFVGLAAARHEVLRRAGWNVEEDGLQGAPEIHVVAGAEAHVTAFAALRMLGLGTRRVKRVAVDDQGRMQRHDLARVLTSCSGPTIVCAQAGNVNTGAFDPIDQIVTETQAHGAWLHVDGAFGLWASAAPRFRHLTAGVERADSWALDAHKWLNVPYDCGIAITHHPDAHREAMRKAAAYLARIEGAARDPADWTPEASRRARGFTIYAALRALGRAGVAELVTRCCDLTRRMGLLLGATRGVQIVNEVVVNQVLVRFHPQGSGDADALTRAVIARVQQDGTCWAGSTTWRDVAAMRISVSGWNTTEADIERSAAAILRAYHEELRR